MVKASIEVVKNKDGRVESGTVIVQGKKLKFNNVWDDSGLLRRIEFDGRYIPTFSELYLFMNEKFIERIRRIDLIDLISEISNISSIDLIDTITNILNIDNIANIERIGRIDNVETKTNPIRNSAFLTDFTAWINLAPTTITIVDDATFGKCVKFNSTAGQLQQYFSVDSNVYNKFSFLAYKPAVGGANIHTIIVYTDGTNTDTVTALTNTWTAYVISLAANKTVYGVGIYDEGGICYFTLPQLVFSNVISATDLDIRDLTSASDSVEAKQATASNLNANVFTKHDNKTYKTAVFDAAASGNLVAAVAAKVIKLHALTIQAQGTVVVNLNNGAGGASLMEWSFQAREGAVVPMANAPAYWAITGVNTILYVTLSAAVQVTITAIYSDDDAA